MRKQSIFQKFISELKQAFAPPAQSKEAVLSPQPQKPQATPTNANTSAAIENPKVKNHRVTGTSHHEKNILKLASENEDYLLTKKELIKAGLIEKDIYQYKFHPNKTELIPEPTNPHDPKAIKVVIDGEHVGYIKAGSCSHILKLINENRIECINSTIGGGAYKCIIAHDDGGEDFELLKDKKNYSINIAITEK